MTDPTQPSLFEKIRKLWPFALIAALGGGLIWYKNIKDAGKEIVADVDSEYHQRVADGALLQLARIPGESKAGAIRYMATLENRSSDSLIVTGLIYDIVRISAASAAIDNGATGAPPDAGPMKGAEIYNLEGRCEEGAVEPLVPPFRINPHATGSFEVTVSKSVASPSSWGCLLEVRFRTNQGETNGILPDPAKAPE